MLPYLITSRLMERRLLGLAAAKPTETVRQPKAGRRNALEKVSLA